MGCLLAVLSPQRRACIYLDMPNSDKFNLTESIALLTRTPATLNVLLRGLPEVWTHSNEGNDTWSAFDIVGHLIVADRTDWMPRVRTILEHGEARPFNAFDRFAQKKESEGNLWSSYWMILPWCGTK